MKKLLFMFLVLCFSVLALSTANPEITFAVLSDIHSKPDPLKNALIDLKSINPELTALVLNGDTVDLGQPEDYAKISLCLEENSALLPKIVIKNMGNHEFYQEYGRGPNSRKSNDILIARYLDFSSRVLVYDDNWINGYHFIHMGSESTYNKYVDSSTVRATISDEQILWFEEKLAEDYTPGKPIFVFLHQPLDNTVVFSHYYRYNINKDQVIRSIFEKYPEIIFFSSHSHHCFELPGNFYTDPSGFKCVDTSSVSRPTYIDTKEGVEKEWVPSSEGVYVEVFKDKVVIKAREFKKSEWIKDAQFVINY